MKGMTVIRREPPSYREILIKCMALRKKVWNLMFYLPIETIHSNTPITLDKSLTTISKFRKIGPDRSYSLPKVHCKQCSQQLTCSGRYGCGQAWRAWQSFQHAQNLRGEIVELLERTKSIVIMGYTQRQPSRHLARAALL